MRKTLIASLLSAIFVSSALAGPSYCPPESEAKCPIVCCPDAKACLPGCEPEAQLHMSYMTDYFFRGVRYSRDAVSLGASYTFDACNVPITTGFTHISSLASGDVSRLGLNGDQTNLFVEAGLPSLCGFDFSLRYDHYLYPNFRGRSGSIPAPTLGDSHGQIGLTVSRELFGGVTASFTSAYDFNSPSAQFWPAFDTGNHPRVSNNENGSWIHTLALAKSFCIADGVSLDLNGGVVYTDNIWPRGSYSTRSAGWNHYFIEASLPISVGECATLAPFIGYNGSPDSWLADGVRAGTVTLAGANENDALYGGVRFNIAFGSGGHSGKEVAGPQNGEASIFYGSDYFFRGVRYARDHVGLAASYTFDGCIIPVTAGFSHISSLASGEISRLGINGDHTNLFAEVGLPSVCSFDFALRYDHFLYPNFRGPSGSIPPSTLGDSHGQIGLTVSRELFCGIGASFTSAYDFNSPAAQFWPAFDVGRHPQVSNNDDGAWLHTFALDKSICITNCISIDLNGGVVYTDNVWPRGSYSTRSAGWNHYFIEASLPISVGPCGTLAPYLGYNGTPDGWMADGVRGGVGSLIGANENDALHGGVRFSLGF